MKIKTYSLDKWFVIPAIVYYNDADWDNTRSIELAWFNRTITFEWKTK